MKDVDRLETDFGIKLPKDYKQQILSINGKSYANVYIPHKKLKEIPYSRNVSLNKRDRYNIYDIYGKVIEDTRYFPFANTGSGNYFCFDLKKNQVVLWIHETDDIIYICDTFTKFQKMMKL